MDAVDGTQAAEIRSCLDKIIASPTFAASARRAKLLRYLVERMLCGEGEKINEYAIGLDVFDKSPSFDPRVESIVRNEVSRLRQKMKEYYSNGGQADRIVIDLPLRSYSPVIGFREPQPLPAIASVPPPHKRRSRQTSPSLGTDHLRKRVRQPPTPISRHRL